MVNIVFERFVADDRSYFALIKKDIHRIISNGNFPKTSINNLDIIIAELTSNLQKYSTGGAEFLVRLCKDNANEFLEVVCMDNGPGIANLTKVLNDHFSSSNTLGHGLGSIRRLSDEFDIYSQPGWGTIIVIRIFKDPQKPQKESPQLRFGALLVPKFGEIACGDGYCLVRNRNGFRVLVADGLGHGPDAQTAVKAAIDTFINCKEEQANDVVKVIHQNIRKTRGVVANVYLFNTVKKEWNICGVGNISTKFLGGVLQKNYIPYNGIIGHNIPNTLNDVMLKKEDYNQFVACSDGIRSRWDLLKFPELLKRDPMIITAAVYKEFARQNDDMSVVSCKIL